MSSPYPRARASPSQSTSLPPTRSGLSREYTSSSVEQLPQVITEFAQLLVDNDDRFNQKLDAASHQQKALHVQSLADSLRRHDAVRESAERVQQQILCELAAEQVRLEQEQTRKLAEAKEKLAAEQKAHLERLEEERQREEQRQQQEARLKHERDEAVRRKRQEAEQKAKDKAAREKEVDAARQKEIEAVQQAQAQAEAEQAKQQQEQQSAQARQQQSSSTAQPQTSGAGSLPGLGRLAALQSSPDQREREHRAYMVMKRELKKSVATLDAAKQHDPWLKQNLGDSCRRRIRTLMGQVNKMNKVENSTKIKEIQAIMNDARTRYPTETLDISPFFIGGNPEPSQSPQFPLLLFDLLNHFAKAVINQLATEASVDRAAAEPIGIVTATIFADPNNTFHGHSLITILWARFHQRCPVLFGIWGDERMPAGRQTMGWKDKDAAQFVEVTKGLASGFAAITLRDFSRNKKSNPAPNRIFWECISRIVNTPADRRLPTHFVALESLLDPIFVPRFIAFYGQAAIAVLKLATGEFSNIPADRVPVIKAAKRMESLKVKLSIELNIWL